MRSLPCDSARRSGVANPLIRGSQPVWMVTRVAREAKRARSSPFRLPGDASPSSRSAGAVGRSSSMAMSMQDKIVESASRASPRARINSQRRRPPRHLHDVCSIAWWRGSLAAGVSAAVPRHDPLGCFARRLFRSVSRVTAGIGGHSATPRPSSASRGTRCLRPPARR